MGSVTLSAGMNVQKAVVTVKSGKRKNTGESGGDSEKRRCNVHTSGGLSSTSGDKDPQCSEVKRSRSYIPASGMEIE